MRQTRNAFTLIELVIVLAIILVLAGLLFPVFSSARASAYRATCLSNFKQAQMAFFVYGSDYDDRTVVVNHRLGMPGDSRNDRTWVQLILPYLRSFALFRCPSDYGRRPGTEATFDADLVPGDTDARYYTASMRSNIGYNYAYLSPVFFARGQWNAVPKTYTEVGDISKTILFVDSVWSVDSKGVPSGGGSWLVLPPCRYYSTGGQVIDSFGLEANYRLFTPMNAQGWMVKRTTGSGLGFTWPWHDGTMNVARTDGSAMNLSPSRLTAGCFLRPNWAGFISDPKDYEWDTF